MRDALSFNMIPIVQDNFEGIDLNSGLMNQITSISSSNGYYGYQPPLMLPVDQKQTIYETVTPTIDNNNVNNNNFNNTDMDIQFNCYSDTQDYCADQMEAEAVRNGAIYRFGGKKRQWDADFPVENSGKKRRQNCDEPVVPFLSTVPEQHPPSPPPPPPQTTQKTLYLRTPTHNIPDLPRCIMDLAGDGGLDADGKNRQKYNEQLMEDLLRETHGCTSYHWSISSSYRATQDF